MDTRYYGIWIQEENGEYWIQDANGGDLYCGRTMPTDEQVTAYRNAVVR